KHDHEIVIADKYRLPLATDSHNRGCHCDWIDLKTPIGDVKSPRSLADFCGIFIERNRGGNFTKNRQIVKLALDHLERSFAAEQIDRTLSAMVRRRAQLQRRKSAPAEM